MQAGLTKQKDSADAKKEARLSPKGEPIETDRVIKQPQERARSDEERWSEEKAVLRRAAEELAQRRVKPLVLNSQRPVNGDDTFEQLAESLEDESADVRHAAIRGLYRLDPDRAASFVNLSLREGPAERRRQIGATLAGSGLLNEAIEDLTGEDHENSYGAFSLLFLVAKAGEVDSLMRVIESHPSIELRLCLIRLLASNGERDVMSTFHRLAARASLPPEVRSAVMEAICQFGETNDAATSAA